MTTGTQTLAAWLLEQIAADEAVHPEHGFLLNVEHHASDCAVVTWLSDYNPTCDCGGDARWLAVCEAHRRIVELHGGYHECEDGNGHGPDDGEEFADPCPTLTALAAIYADRDGFRSEWR